MIDNLHPVDELLQRRAERNALDARIDELRGMILSMEPSEREGREACARVVTQQRSKLDHKAIVYEMGQKWVDEHSVKSEISIVRVEPRT
ncbi:MAG: hypothetical protein WCZ66_12060 [Sphingomonadaceae bacterium]